MNVPQHVGGEPHCARLLCDRLLHRLAEPPGRVRRERNSSIGLEPTSRTKNAEHPFLYEVCQLDIPPCVPASSTNDERKTVLDQRLTRRVVTAGRPRGQSGELIASDLGIRETAELLVQISSRRRTGGARRDLPTELAVELERSVHRPPKLPIVRRLQRCAP